MEADAMELSAPSGARRRRPHHRRRHSRGGAASDASSSSEEPRAAQSQDKSSQPLSDSDSDSPNPRTPRYRPPRLRPPPPPGLGESDSLNESPAVGASLRRKPKAKRFPLAAGAGGPIRAPRWRPPALWGPDRARGFGCKRKRGREGEGEAGGSDSEGGASLLTCDEGREADDEQSDWHDGGAGPGAGRQRLGKLRERQRRRRQRHSPPQECDALQRLAALYSLRLRVADADGAEAGPWDAAFDTSKRRRTATLCEGARRNDEEMETDGWPGARVED